MNTFNKHLRLKIVKLIMNAKEGHIPSSLSIVDILNYISNHNSLRPKLVIGFAAETHNIKNNAKKKLMEKNCDWIIANDVSDQS